MKNVLATPLSDILKNKIEIISGYDLSDVRVHYNSSKPKILTLLPVRKGKIFT